MEGNDEARRAQMRARLKSPKAPRKGNSVAADVRALSVDLQKQRELGKTWEQIAREMYGAPGNKGAVRSAFNRLDVSSSTSRVPSAVPRVRKEKVAPVPPQAIKDSTASPNPAFQFNKTASSLFAPINDAADDRRSTINSNG